MNPPQGELLATVGRVVAAFETLGIEYLIGGSVASSVFGEPRHTMDADLVAAILEKHAKPLVDLLGSAFYVDCDAILGAVTHQSCFNLIHLETMTKVDVFASGRTPFGESQLLRKQKIAIGEGAPTFYFASPEDMILAKLDWFKKGGLVSDRQWRDILGILKVQGDRLDFSYLGLWAKKMELDQILESALNG